MKTFSVKSCNLFYFLLFIVGINLLTIGCVKEQLHVRETSNEIAHTSESTSLITSILPPVKYRIRLQVIPLRDDNGNRSFTMTPEQMLIHVQDTNEAFATAGMRFEFDPLIDWNPLNNTALNSMVNWGSSWWEIPKL